MSENEIGKIIVDCAVLVHKKLGPRLLEIVYEVALSRELQNRGLSIERQVSMPIVYDGIKFDEGFRVDIVVASKVIILDSAVEVDEGLQDIEFENVVRKRKFTQKAGQFDSEP